jgi:hypothetical protein
MYSLVSFAVASGMALKSVGASYYCASFSEENTNGVDGIFQMEMSDEKTATYSMSFQVASTFTSKCDLTAGLDYSINTLWKSPYDSASGSNCDSTITGYHYDPNLACSSQSESYKSKCIDAGRTFGNGFKYSCSSSVYAEGIYVSCERGDLSGKFGTLKGVYNEESDMLSFSNITGLVDYNPPYPGNLHQSDDLSSAWSSIVFSCPSTGETLFCSEFALSESVCSSDNRAGLKGLSVTWNDDDGFWRGEGVTLDWFDLSLLIVIFFMAVCSLYCACRFGVYYYCCGCCRKDKNGAVGGEVSTTSRRTARERRPLLG